MSFISGKRAFLELLKQEGVDTIFGNPGTTELPLMDILAVEQEIRYVLGLQEAAVLAMADGYAQASGRLAVVNLHVAPGLGNALGMLYDAQKAGSPILVTAGQHDQSFTFTEPILWAELTTIARPFVKWAAEVRRLADLPRAVHRAAKTALAPPTGPVFLSVPADVLNAEAELDLGAPTRIASGLRGDPSAVEQAAELLARAERPLVIAGDIVAQSDAHIELVRLAELIGAPVYLESIPSTASFPSSHPLYRGAMARLAPAIRDVLERHDLLFSVGGDLFTLSLPSDVEPVPAGLPIIHLDTDSWEIGKNFAAEPAILGDPKPTLHDIAEALAARMTPERIVVDESLSSGAGLRQLIRSDDPKSFFGMRGGGIGWSLPAAVGVKLAHPERPVVALTGDGSALYTCQALWTAAHERLGIAFVILNNGSYRILKQRTKALRGYAEQTGTYVAMDLDDPPIDFVALARSFGLRAERAETVAEAVQALRGALDGAGPTLIDVMLDPSI